MDKFLAAYSLLKASLGLVAPASEIRDLLYAKIAQADLALQRAGLTLDLNCPADCALVAAYAEWIYRRRNAEDPKPRALTDEIYSRQVTRATTGGGES